MKLGLIGRVDRRGIGYQTGVFWEHMGRPRTLVVQMNDGFPEDLGRFGYDDVFFVDSSLAALTERHLNEKVCRDFLDGLDVVFAVETTYEWEFVNWANQMGVEVWVQGNPEMYGHKNHPFPHPRWCWPTPWLVDELPPGPILPVPCEDRADVAASPDTPELRVLHVAGKHAVGDRNGTSEFVESLRSLQADVHVTIVTQDSFFRHELRHKANVTVDVVIGGVEDRWSMYDMHHVLVLPRKYGGLCLPALEAMASGLAVVLPSCSPNQIWPGPRMEHSRGRNVYTPAGRVRTIECHPTEIAKHISMLADNRDTLRDEMTIAREWADTNTWGQLAPLYWKTLGGQDGDRGQRGQANRGISGGT